MAKELKLFNGRWMPYHERGYHVYIAAYSRADAVRLVNEVLGWNYMTPNEIKVYFSDTWGNPMQCITPERGVWITKGWNQPPERLHPKKGAK